ncbi:MAG TPA: LysM domain-containing protein, partial [Solirubrobacterales bacterium]|nr:LysM domain-containing protein [Solirubrobacterales bacterium]
MNKSSSASARLVAATALAVAFVVAIVAIGGALGGGGDDSNGSGSGRPNGGAAREDRKEPRDTPATYVIESGDTLTSIARANGISVTRIEVLNPDVDPQIL